MHIYNPDPLTASLGSNSHIVNNIPFMGSQTEPNNLQKSTIRRFPVRSPPCSGWIVSGAFDPIREYCLGAVEVSSCFRTYVPFPFMGRFVRQSTLPHPSNALSRGESLWTEKQGRDLAAKPRQIHSSVHTSLWG